MHQYVSPDDVHSISSTYLFLVLLGGRGEKNSNSSCYITKPTCQEFLESQFQKQPSKCACPVFVIQIMLEWFCYQLGSWTFPNNRNWLEARQEIQARLYWGLCCSSGDQWQTLGSLACSFPKLVPYVGWGLGCAQGSGQRGGIGVCLPFRWSWV